MQWSQNITQQASEIFEIIMQFNGGKISQLIIRGSMKFHFVLIHISDKKKPRIFPIFKKQFDFFADIIRCNFEQLELCPFEQDPNDELDWDLYHSPPSPSPLLSGSYFDHTYGQVVGEFLPHHTIWFPLFILMTCSKPSISFLFSPYILCFACYECNVNLLFFPSRKAVSKVRYSKHWNYNGIAHMVRAKYSL